MNRAKASSFDIWPKPPNLLGFRESVGHLHNPRTWPKRFYEGLAVIESRQEGHLLLRRQFLLERLTLGGDHLLSYQRAVILTGINIPSAAPDLLDRTLLIELTPPTTRRNEAELMLEFESVRADIFRGLLNVIRFAMQLHDTLTIESLPRMADFVGWGAAAAEALGYGSQAFLTAYRSNLSKQTEEVLSSDPLAHALRELATNHAAMKSAWVGSASALLAALNEIDEVEGKKGDDWPKRPADLGKKIKLLESTLLDAGVRVTKEDRTFTVEMDAKVENRNVQRVSDCRDLANDPYASQGNTILAICT